MDKLQVISKHRYAMISPKKMAIVMDLIRGKSLQDAKVLLAFDRTKSAKLLFKCLRSAEANAVNNLKLSKDNLYVYKVWVDGGPMYKRASMGAKGRIDPILKRTSHINVVLSQVELKQVPQKKVVKAVKKEGNK